MSTIRSRLAAVCCGLVLAVMGSPAHGLERLVLRFPFLETSITLNLAESSTADELIRSSPDLADLLAASDGRLLELLRKVFQAPLPVETKQFLQGSTGQPLLEQALMAATDLVDLQGVEADTTGHMLTDALIRAEANQQPTILGFLRELPGEEASIQLGRVIDAANRLKANQDKGVALAKAGPAAAVTVGLQPQRKPVWTRQKLTVAVSHRPQALPVLTLVPTGNANGRLVVISHGLWDDPESFEGWGEFLATHGYTVLMPDHPGSNSAQQKAMLAGDRRPPGAEELRLRPLDVSALLDAVASGRLLSGRGLNTQSVAVVGHSWGGTTAVQLVGAVPTVRKLSSRCADLRDQERNISWILQCSWLNGIAQAGVADSRVKAAVAVSPPLRLLFEPSSSKNLSSKVLLVSGTRDWVVPSGPEAITPMQESGATKKGHRLVLAEGMDHFNLRSFQGDDRPAVVGPLVLAWINEQLGVNETLMFSSGGWGDSTVNLVDVSDRL
ncbi:MAG: alpha/beta fold hydrolase [Cyanobacteriota bacterium]|nr:alpha/beta fold hydrolase [Cyanobacteriota bacterium]